MFGSIFFGLVLPCGFSLSGGLYVRMLLKPGFSSRYVLRAQGTKLKMENISEGNWAKEYSLKEVWLREMINVWEYLPRTFCPIGLLSWKRPV